MTILLQSATVAIVAIGQAFIMLGGNLDLSLGQNVCLSSYVAAILIKDFGINPWLGLLLCNVYRPDKWNISSDCKNPYIYCNLGSYEYLYRNGQDSF